VEVSAGAFQLDGVWFAAGNVRDITERKQAEQEFKRLANTDDLTGTLNRRRFLELAQAEVLRAQRYGSPLSLLMLDLDHFKAINDTYGHGVGDLVLRSLVEVSKEVLRVVDVFGRVGGEEFMALLPETNLEGALTVAERLRAAFAARTVTAGGNEIRCTASLGVAVLAPDMTLEQLMKAADEALYQAKKRGRNQVVAYQAPAPQT
jgi:diguanylate cyclase (GGDEF)-like protein